MKCVTLEEGMDILREIHEGSMATMPHLEHWLEKRTDQASSSQQSYQTWKTSLGDAMDANSSENKLMFQPTT